MQLSEILTSVYDHLGTSETDPAYPSARITRYINTWLDQLYAELKADSLSKSAILVVDSGQEHRYTLAQQSPSIVDFKKALDVRVTDENGSQLEEKPRSELTSAGGWQYAITGADQVAVLHTSPGVTASVAIYLLYSYWPTKLSVAGDTPSAVPERLRWVIALGAAEFAFEQGGEARFPVAFKEKLDDGRALLLAHMGRRSLDVATRRTTDSRR